MSDLCYQKESYCVSNCALLFTKGHHGDSNYQKVKVIIKQVNFNHGPILSLSVSSPSKKEIFDIQFNGNTSGAAAYIVGQSNHWDHIELYTKSDESKKEVLAEWSLMLDYNKCLNNDISSVKSILDTLEMHSLSRREQTKNWYDPLQIKLG